MKKSLSILLSILTISLLSACGSSGNDASSPELLFEQPTTAEETPSEEQQTESLEKETVESPEPAIETDILKMMIGYDNTPPNDSVYHYFYYDLDDNYPSFNSGRLFDDTLFMPMIVKIEDSKGTQIELEGEEGRKIKEIFEEVYNNSFEPMSDYFDEIYQEQAKIYAEMPNHEEQQIDKQMEPVDISDKVPDTLKFDIPNNPLEMQIISANVVGSGCGILKPNDGKEAPLPSWTTDDGRIIWLNMLQVNLSVPKEQSNELKAYLTEQISAADKGADVEETGETNGTDGTDATKSEPIPEGKNFDNVTGFEGYWYNQLTGKLEFVLFSDMTGYGVDDYDGSIHEIEYSISNEYKMLYIIGWNDDFYCDIVDANTLGGDTRCVRKPYEGGLENADFSDKSNDSVKFTTSDLTGFWSDPNKYSYTCFLFNGDGTGTYYFGNGKTTTMTYSVDGNTITYNLPKSSGYLTIINKDKLDFYGTAYYKE